MSLSTKLAYESTDFSVDALRRTSIHLINHFPFPAWEGSYKFKTPSNLLQLGPPGITCDLYHWFLVWIKKKLYYNAGVNIHCRWNVTKSARWHCDQILARCKHLSADDHIIPHPPALSSCTSKRYSKGEISRACREESLQTSREGLSWSCGRGLLELITSFLQKPSAFSLCHVTIALHTLVPSFPWSETSLPAPPTIFEYKDLIIMLAALGY